MYHVEFVERLEKLLLVQLDIGLLHLGKQRSQQTQDFLAESLDVDLPARDNPVLVIVEQLKEILEGASLGFLVYFRGVGVCDPFGFVLVGMRFSHFCLLVEIFAYCLFS